VRIVRDPDRPGALALDEDLVVAGDNLAVLPGLPAGHFDLIYVDPPFNTGKRRRRLGPDGAERAYDDASADYVAFLEPRVREARRLLAAHGTLYVHLDYREAHYAKLLLDSVFGREAFLNELIWAYDYGGKPRTRWPAKHDTILAYVRTPGAHHFDADAVEREPYMAPGLAGAEKAARGKLPTDVIWHTIVSPTGREKTGYPTQKPEGLVRRLVAASSRPGGWCLDFFAGSGTVGAVCADLGRRYVLVDANPEAVEVMADRLAADQGRASSARQVEPARR
jgi:site-specific DNA-methyltransferase (adenine-specific)